MHIRQENVWTPRPPTHKFDHLRDFNYIVVTGPHRAGTTILTAMISNDLGHTFIEHNHTTVGLQVVFDHELGPAVIHAPSHSAFVHHYHDIPGLCVVMVKRNIDDIIASQKRVGWGFEQRQLSFYPYGSAPPIARVKYNYWEKVQKPILGNKAFEIEYESLKDHPMWVPKEDRKDFWIAQIEPGKPRGNKVQNPALVETDD